MIRTSHQLVVLFSLLLQTFVFAQKSPTVIELFTSQGCSSCPPADVLLEQIKNEYGDDVITLSYHVDYWDYIGWKDPFATKQFTRKQYTYAEKFKSRSVYTPQAVINGRTHHTGSDKSALYRVLNAKNELTKPLGLAITKTRKAGKSIAINYQLVMVNSADELTFVIAINEKTTHVKRGENRNKTLKNTHIVVAEHTIVQLMTNGQIVVQLPDWIEDSDELSVVAYATKANVGIIDATITKLL